MHNKCLINERTWQALGLLPSQVQDWAAAAKVLIPPSVATSVHWTRPGPTTQVNYNFFNKTLQASPATLSELIQKMALSFIQQILGAHHRPGTVADTAGATVGNTNVFPTLRASQSSGRGRHQSVTPPVNIKWQTEVSVLGTEGMRSQGACAQGLAWFGGQGRILWGSDTLADKLKDLSSEDGGRAQRKESASQREENVQRLWAKNAVNQEWRVAVWLKWGREKHGLGVSQSPMLRTDLVPGLRATEAPWCGRQGAGGGPADLGLKSPCSS